MNMIGGSTPEVSIVVPVYKARESLRQLHEACVDAMVKEEWSYEIIYVEDCGQDGSWEEIERLVLHHDNVVGVALRRNYGQHAATLCGINHASGRWVVTIDDDLQHDPKHIARLIEEARKGYDLVYGVFPLRDHKAWRNITSRIARFLYGATIDGMNIEYTSFRALSRSLAEDLREYSSPQPFIDAHMSWLTNRYSIVELEHRESVKRSSTYSFRKLLAHALHIFFSASYRAMRFVLLLGVVFFVIGVSLFVYVVAARLLGGITVSGYASIIAGLVLFGGMQMLVLGMIGEYLGRIASMVSDRRAYSVRKKVGLS